MNLREFFRLLRVLLVSLVAFTAVPASAQDKIEVDPSHVWAGAYDGFLLFNHLNIVLEDRRFAFFFSRFEEAEREMRSVHDVLAKAVSERKRVRVDLVMLATIEKAKRKESTRLAGSVGTGSVAGVLLSKLPYTESPSDAFELVEAAE
jgi:hypothetical protein